MLKTLRKTDHIHGNRYPFILIGLALIVGIICGMLSPVAPDTLHQPETAATHSSRGVIVDHKTDSPALAAISSTPYLLPAGRSPLPQPNETFGKPMGYTRLEQVPPDRLINTDRPVVPWYQPKNTWDKPSSWRGIVHTRHVSSACFLNFSSDRRDSFYVVLFGASLDVWPQSPQGYFLNKTIQVRGTVTTYRKRPQIRVDHASQITIVDQKPAGR